MVGTLMRKLSIQGALVLVTATLCAGGFLAASASAAPPVVADAATSPVSASIPLPWDKPPPKKDGQAPLQDGCDGHVDYDVGDVWVEDFFELPNGPRAAKDKVRYQFRACWVPMLARIQLDSNPFCSGESNTTPVPLADGIDLAIGIFHSPKAKPKRKAKPTLPIGQFTLSPDDKKPNSLRTLCRTYTTPPVKRPSTRGGKHAPWIRVQPDGPRNSEWSFQNGILENDFMIGRSELTVDPGTFTTAVNGSIHEVTQSFKVCNEGGVVSDVLLGLNVAHPSSKTAAPTTWTSFVEVGKVKARKCKTVSHTFNTHAGMFRGFVKVDPKATVQEASETNNVASFDYGAVEVNATTPRGGRSSKRKRPAKRRRGGTKPPSEREPSENPPEAPSEGEGGGGERTGRGSSGDVDSSGEGSRK